MGICNNISFFHFQQSQAYPSAPWMAHPRTHWQPPQSEFLTANTFRPTYLLKSLHGTLNDNRQSPRGMADVMTALRASAFLKASWATCLNQAA